jgi:hypothetical protein
MSYNVFLSGGGIKGAYQYGFFKQVYRKRPDFKINKIYSVSVGSLNAIPILLKKMEYLQPYWEPTNDFPINNIFNPWDSIESLTYHKSLFKSLNMTSLNLCLQNLTPAEKYRVYKSLNIFSYNKRQKTPIKFDKLFFSEDIIQACSYSSSFPSLIPQLHPDITDGVFVKGKQYKNMIESTDDNWVVLDVSDTFVNLDFKNCEIYSPEIYKNTILNTLSTINITTPYIRCLVLEGQKHADSFLSRLP